jgi:NADPH2:quinone reductase
MINSHIAEINTSGSVILKKTELPELKPHEVTVRSHFSSISSGTESALMAGKILPLPQIIGYSLAGIVEAVGSDVNHIKVGDAVVSTAAHADLQNIDAANVTLVPNGVSLESACFFNLAHTALYAIRQSEIQPGQPLLVIGQGLVGQLITQFAQLAGALPVVAIENNPERLALAGLSGADIGIAADEAEEAIPALLNELSIQGFPAVIEATGLRDPLNNAIKWVAERGKVVMMSTTAGDGDALDTHTLMMKGASLVGGYVNSKPFALQRRDLEIVSWPPSMSTEVKQYQAKDEWSSDEDIKVFLNALKFGRIDIEHLISHRFSWQEIPAAYELVNKKDRHLMGGVFAWRE